MSADLLAKTKVLCQTYGIVPQRNKGQNFLVSSDILDIIMDTAAVNSDDVVLEAGPGLGILTEQLVSHAQKVVSVELDDKLFELLQTKFLQTSNVEFIHKDILLFEPNVGILGSSYKIVANLPYNISSRFLKKFLTAPFRPTTMTLLLQKEVVERIVAPPGEMSLLAVSAQLYGQPHLVAIVNKKHFWPSPDVDSAVLHVANIKTQKEVDNFLGEVSEKFFWKIVKIGFSARRKQLQNNLSAGLLLEPEMVQNLLKKADFDPKIRAQNLSVYDWIKLAHVLNKNNV